MAFTLRRFVHPHLVLERQHFDDLLNVRTGSLGLDLVLNRRKGIDRDSLFPIKDPEPGITLKPRLYVRKVHGQEGMKLLMEIPVLHFVVHLGKDHGRLAPPLTFTYPATYSFGIHWISVWPSEY